MTFSKHTTQCQNNRYNAKHNNRMIKYLIYINRALLTINFVSLLFELESFYYLNNGFQRYFAANTILGKFHSMTVDFFFTYFVFVYPFVWCVFWRVRSYYKMKFSFVWLLNTLFFIYAFFWLFMWLLPEFI